ncbi:MAG: hypothetical protein LC730_00345, partial [Acidobacteria bacterium]|nr:hypothetical protein [Acidobacteriota bacterium]
MSKQLRCFAVIAAFFVIIAATQAQKNRDKIEVVPPSGYKPLAIENSPELQSILVKSIGEVLDSYPARGFKADDIAATLIDLRDPSNLT